jgi:hypothetical protein
MAGHGATVQVPEKDEKGEVVRSTRRGFFLPYDAECSLDGTSPLEAYERSAIDFSKLSQRLLEQHSDTKTTRHIVMILDACFSGFASQPKARGATLSTGAAGLLCHHPTRQVMTGGTELQQTLELPDPYNHGVFTWSVLQELERGRKGDLLTLTELFAKARVSVLTKAEERGQLRTSQEPILRSLIQSDGDFVFIPLSAADEAIQKSVGEESEAARQRGRVDPVTEEEVAQVREEAKQNKPRNDEDAKKRFERFREAAARGDPKGAEALFYCYQAGLGTEKDPRAARAWGQETCEVSDPDTSQKIFMALRDMRDLKDIELSGRGIWEAFEDPEKRREGTEAFKSLVSMLPSGGPGASLERIKKSVTSGDWEGAYRELVRWKQALKKNPSASLQDVQEKIEDLDKAIERTARVQAIEHIDKLAELVRAIESKTSDTKKKEE